ncbi:ribosomal-protein-L7/L12-serine acetyltransferase [Alphaproteobacteria bacterium]|nr:ribosomal-protein-L7/L12-serine acetyltransferase [Alphaproteobacteria bacterium]
MKNLVAFILIIVTSCCDVKSMNTPFSRVIFPVTLTEACVLRPFNEHDAKRLSEVIDENRDFLRLTLGWLDGFHSEEDSLTFIKQAIVNYSDGLALSLCIECSGDIVGTIVFNKIEENQEDHTLCGDIGYWLAKSMNGRGIMTAAVKAIVKIGFEVYLLDKIFIRCGTTNKESRRVAERCGFELQNEIKEAENLYGTLIDHYLFVLVKPSET